MKVTLMVVDGLTATLLKELDVDARLVRDGKRLARNAVEAMGYEVRSVSSGPDGIVAYAMEKQAPPAPEQEPGPAAKHVGIFGKGNIRKGRRRGRKGKA